MSKAKGSDYLLIPMVAYADKYTLLRSEMTQTKIMKLGTRWKCSVVS